MNRKPEKLTETRSPPRDISEKLMFSTGGATTPSVRGSFDADHTRNPDLNAGDIAQKLGVSNGAVSGLSQLERKGVIKKYKDPASRTGTAAFTDLGKRLSTF